MLEQTFSLCPVCLARLPAQRIEEGDAVYLCKECPEHGPFKTILWRGEPGLGRWRKEELNTPPKEPDTPQRLGCPYDCGLCGSHEQTACCIVVEVTERCGLGCSVCFADSKPEGGDLSMEELREMEAFLFAKSPENPFNIQLSGGEPCEREDIVQIVELFKARFPHVQLNSNGIRLAEDPSLAKRLKDAGLSCVFLQFYGTAEEIYHAMNGRPMLDIKKRALDNCAAAGLPVVLAMAVGPANKNNVGATLDFALSRIPHVRGIHFLPVGYMGRHAEDPGDGDRITLPELVRAIERQSLFKFSAQSLVPLVSGSCECSFHGNYFVEDGGQITPLTSQEDAVLCACKQNAVASARRYLSRRWGRAAGEWGEWGMFLEKAEERGFSITAMAFMDAWNFDGSRIKKCRLHALTRNLRLIPFCAYNVTSTTGERLYARE